jgi:hypothetical protein
MDGWRIPTIIKYLTTQKLLNMKKQLIFSTLLIFIAGALFAQTYKTREGVIYFNPNKNPENTEYSAQSKEATALLKVESNEVALLVPMKSFRFNNALLEEHFNENYLHTNKYPNGTYKGKLIGFSKSMLEKDGDYNLKSEGEIELHGVKKAFNSTVVLKVKNKVATFVCNFYVKANDYNIAIPDLVKPKLAESTPLAATIPFKLN